MGQPDLSVSIGDLRLSNPVMTASGTCGYGLDLDEWIDISRLGAVVLKGLSAEPRAGNPPPRVVETPSGLLNSIGLENIGVEAFVRDVLPLLKKKKAALIANVYATVKDDFIKVSRILEETGSIKAVELNLSCPNVSAGGMAFGRDPVQAASLVAAVRKNLSIPLIVKLTPTVEDITLPAIACQESGADALTVTNTYPGMAVDILTRRPVLGADYGGLSGPAIKPMALKLVWDTCRAVRIPVIAGGGISTWRDALEFIIAGAAAIQAGTAVLVDPWAPLGMIEGIGRFMADQGIESLEDLRGTLKLNNP